MLAVPFAPQAVAKTAAATTASQPEIASGSAMIVDLNTNKVIYSNHPDLVRPIASISKLMTAMVVLDARLPLDEKLKVDISQTPEMKGVYSRGHCCKVSDEAAFCLIQRPYISKTLLTRRISPRGSP